MRLLLFTFIILNLGFAQTVQKRQNSKWIYAVTEDYSDSLQLFADGHYSVYSCEQEETSFGVYKIAKDTLILFKEFGGFGTKYSKDGKKGNGLFKYLFKQKTLQLIYSQPNVNRPPSNEFVQNYIFHKIK